jgi:cobalt-zinc-cadmium resistance protein CzcA
VTATRLGSEFIPRLSEGTIVFNTIRLASVGLDESQRYGTRIEQLVLKEFPDEVERVWTRTGTAEVATDPMGLEVSDVFVTLKPREGWKRAETQEELVNAMSAEVDRLPGLTTVFSQPIEQRINEMIAGIRADLGVKIFGDDLDVLKAKADEVAKVLEKVRGAADVAPDQLTGLPVLRVEVDRQALARYGIPARLVLDSISAVGGTRVGDVREQERRFPLVVRLPDALRDDPAALEQILIPTVTGQRIPITKLARFTSTIGPSSIPREWGKRLIVVQANVRGRDVGSFVEEARAAIQREVVMPVGYTIEWGGQFENLARARTRLMIVVPLALALIVALLYMTFGELRDALIIFSGVFFAHVGGTFGLWYKGMPFTISAGIGFIVLAGVAMLEGLVLVSSIRDKMASGATKLEAIRSAQTTRLRPVLMTGTVAALGFIPMMLSSGIGAEVQRPLATVVVFGMAFDTLLTMLALPAIYLLFGKGPAERGDEGPPRRDGHAAMILPDNPLPVAIGGESIATGPARAASGAD